MKLTDFTVTEYQSVLSSGKVETKQITCLVGKNEAGKSALLKALYRLNPIVPEDGKFSVTDDYPRLEVGDYEDEVAAGKRRPAIVIAATFELEKDDLTELSDQLGDKALKNRRVRLSKGYENKLLVSVDPDEKAILTFLKGKLPTEAKEATQAASTWAELHSALEPFKSDATVAPIHAILGGLGEQPLSLYVWTKWLKKHFPTFLYFDEYYQLTGCENVDELMKRKAENRLKPSDQPLLGLVETAGLKLDQLLNAQRTQEIKNKLEGAGNRLTRRILDHWSQNRHLEMRFDVRPAKPGDPEGMRSGQNIWGEVYDKRHLATTGLGTRSRGFVWFFSFVAWYTTVRNRGDKVILLLDEPGLTLHGRAQGDLLRYFAKELAPHHQLIYTTHSPFMIDPQHFDQVRIVQDKSVDIDGLPKEEQGTKVVAEVFDATDDSLFPLQGALGYDIHQTLFVGPNTLLVEGPSDMLYINAMSSLLEREGREGLDGRWTLAPVGGASKITAFVRLLSNQKGMNLAALIDIQDKDRPAVENLYRDKLLKKSHVLTYADFTSTTEADIEDMFEHDFYLDLVNAEYKGQLPSALKPKDLKSKAPRLLSRLQAHFEQTPLKKGTFGHYRPSRYFHENLDKLAASISDVTKERFEKAFKALNALL